MDCFEALRLPVCASLCIAGLEHVDCPLKSDFVEEI